MEIIIEQAPTPYEGVVRVRTLPEDIDTQEKFITLWKSLTSRERERYTTFEAKNLITTAGLAAINAFLGSWTSVPGFAKYLALGTGALAGPAAGDTSLVTEVFRKAPALLTVVGNTSDITTYLQATDAQFALTEAGLFTGAATGTANSGTLATHLLFPVNNAVSLPKSIDYLLVRN